MPLRGGEGVVAVDVGVVDRKGERTGMPQRSQSDGSAREDREGGQEGFSSCGGDPETVGRAPEGTSCFSPQYRGIPFLSKRPLCQIRARAYRRLHGGFMASLRRLRWRRAPEGTRR